MSMTRRGLFSLSTSVLPEDNGKTSEKGLEPFDGEWTFEMSGHLLSRTLFGPTYRQIQNCLKKGLSSTIEELFNVDPDVAPPLNYYFSNDPDVSVGETWVNAPTQRVQGLNTSRRRSLYGWTLGLMVNQEVSILEKMVLFWHNHFVISNIGDPKYVYRYSMLLRHNALGNFKNLTKKMTVEPAMLRYLNGNQNTDAAPNENYARELLELFTIGKGELAGYEDYSTFTEQDVIAIARALTGWRDFGYFGTRSGDIVSEFVSRRHDTGVKQLSHRFDHEIIHNADQDEYKNVIDIIFKQKEVARFIARKLYRWFVYYQIDDTVESKVIEPLAEKIFSDGFLIEPALKMLLSSAHFFDQTYVGAMIKNPLDFILGTVRQLEIEPEDTMAIQYEYWFRLFAMGEPLQMSYYFAPSVAGWKAFYQEPGFYQIWINSSTLPIRMDFTEAALENGVPVGRRLFAKPDVLKWIEQFEDPLDPNALIGDMANLFFPSNITEAQHDTLKEVLLPGLPDYEWTIEYTDYLANPSDNLLKQSIEAKLRNLINTMMQMPEFFLA